jgi:hypothetical protein
VLGPLDATQRAALRAQGVSGFAVEPPREAARPKILQAKLTG